MVKATQIEPRRQVSKTKLKTKILSVLKILDNNFNLTSAPRDIWLWRPHRATLQHNRVARNNRLI